MVGDWDKNSARLDKGHCSTRRTVYHDARRPRTWSRCRLGEPAMDIVIHTAERACVLVTLTFILRRPAHSLARVVKSGPASRLPRSSFSSSWRSIRSLDSRSSVLA